MEAKSITKVKSEVKGIQAQVEMWKYALGFTPMAIVKCAIELQIADVLESHGGSMTLSELSAALGCAPSPLYRIMREQPRDACPLARPECTGANDDFPFAAAHGKDLWEYAAANPGHNKLLNDAMACRARMDITAIIDQCSEAFKGIRSLVDVGGGDGTTLRALVEACPWIRGINFDLPHVVSVAPHCDGVEHVGGDMFASVPKADAAILMSVLHDWSDEECIDILKNCREAIDKETGKVIIVETVIEEGEDNMFTDIRLGIDMVMLVHTNKGKERTLKEWEYVITASGFTRYVVKHIEAITDVIEVYP